MLRLDRHLLQHAQQQRVSLIKSSLQAALLAIILLGILLYFTQVGGLRLVKDHEGELTGVQLVSHYSVEDHSAFERERCERAIHALAKAREELVNQSAAARTTQQALVMEQATSRTLREQHTRIKEELKQKALAASVQLDHDRSRAAGAKGEASALAAELRSAHLLIAALRAELVQLNATHQDAITVEQHDRAYNQEQQASTQRSAADIGSGVVEKVLRGAEAQCDAKLRALREDMQSLHLATEQTVSSTADLERRLQAAIAAQKAAEGQTKVCSDGAAVEARLFRVKNDALIAANKELESTLSLRQSEHDAAVESLRHETIRATQKAAADATSHCEGESGAAMELLRAKHDALAAKKTELEASLRSRESTLESLQKKMEAAYQMDCERSDVDLLPEGYHEAEAEARRALALTAKQRLPAPPAGWKARARRAAESELTTRAPAASAAVGQAKVSRRYETAMLGRPTDGGSTQATTVRIGKPSVSRTRKQPA